MQMISEFKIVKIFVILDLEKNFFVIEKKKKMESGSESGQIRSIIFLKCLKHRYVCSGV